VIHNTTFNSIDMNINIHNHILLADINYNSHKNNQDINLLYNILVREQCNLYNNIINLMKMTNVYCTYTDANDQQLIILNKNNQLIINKCININKITINPIINDICYNQFQVNFNINQIQYIGFLTNNQIIISNSSFINCLETSNTLIVQNHKLFRNKMNISIIYYSQKIEKIFEINTNNYTFGVSLNNHFNKLLENIHIKFPHFENNIMNNLDDSFLMQKERSNFIKTFLIHIRDNIYWWLISFGIFFILIIIFIMLLYFKCNFCMKKFKIKKIKKTAEQFELKNLSNYFFVLFYVIKRRFF
jgi:hypothetical protein